jgi:hypothetical protein
MASESPVALIYGSDGSGYIETTIRAGVAVPTGQPGFMALGSDGTNTRYLRMASDGTVRVDPTGTTTQPVSDAGGSLTVDGTVAATQSGAWNITNISGTVSLPTGAATETTLATLLTTTAFQARINTLGQKTMANGTPVTIASDQSAIPASQSGTWNINNVSGVVSLPTGASTSALQTTGNSSLSSIDTKTPALGQAVMSASTPVVIASNQSVLPVNDNGGSLTVDTTQLPAALVSGRLDVNIGASTSIAVTGPLTDTQLRATAVPVSGPLTDAQLRATAVPVSQSGTWTVTANAGTNLNTSALALDASITAQSLVDNAAFTDGTTRVQPVGFIFDEVAGTALTENDAAAARIDSKRAQVLVIEDATTRGQRAAVSSAGAVKVEGGKTHDSAAPNGTNIGVLPAVASTSAPTVTNGNQVALSTDLNGQLRVTASTTGSEEASYTVIGLAVAPGNNKSMLSIYNPTGSGYVLKLREFYLRNAATAAVTGVAGNFQLHRFASASAPTGGTTPTVVSHDSADALPAGMDARVGGTISGEIATPLDILRMSTDEWGPGTLDVEANQQSIANYLPARAKRDGLLKPFFARPGEGLHIKFATNSTAGSIDVVFVFTKV